jgi:hypothetical protein
MLLDGEAVTGAVEGDKYSYTPAEDMADGKHSVSVTVTRADEKSVTRSWNFFVGEGGETLYFGQIHAHTAEYSDGVGTMLCERPDGKYIPLTCTIDTIYLKAVLPDECLSRPGMYLYTANWAQAGTLRRTQIYKTIIQSTDNGRWKPHECPGTPAWATEIFVKAEQIDAAVDAAMQAESVAIYNANAASDQRIAAQAAALNADIAKTKAQDARDAADAHADRAETAADSVTTSTVEETLEYLGIT